MRISTAQMYASTTANISAKQADLARIQNQLSSGKRIASLADDPAAAAGAAVLQSDLSSNGQFDQNRQVAQQRLSFAENTLGAAGDSLQSMRSLLVSAGNGGLSDTDRNTIANQLRQGLDSLVGLANTSDGQGGYLFGGFRETSAPFVATASAVTYAGDDGGRTINVSNTRAIATGFNGADVFSRIATGNGVFTTAAAAANTGSGTIDSGQVSNAAALTGDSYQIRFHAAAGVTTYDVWDTTTNAAVSSANAYAAPASIALPGISVGVAGSPANGDNFDIAPSGNQDIFTTLKNAITVLSTPTNGNTTAVTNGLRVALTNIDQALSHISDQRGVAGARLNELDQVASLSSARNVDLSATLSSLQDVDYVKTISEFSVAQTGVQAALASYAKIAQTKLFDYLK